MQHLTHNLENNEQSFSCISIRAWHLRDVTAVSVALVYIWLNGVRNEIKFFQNSYRFTFFIWILFIFSVRFFGFRFLSNQTNVLALAVEWFGYASVVYFIFFRQFSNWHQLIRMVISVGLFVVYRSIDRERVTGTTQPNLCVCVLHAYWRWPMSAYITHLIKHSIWIWGKKTTNVIIRTFFYIYSWPCRKGK